MSTDTQPQIATVKETVVKEISVRTNHSWARLLWEDSTGRVFITSDYGNWSYCWTSIGSKSLAQFLHDCDTYYLGNKFLGSGYTVYDHWDTIDNIKKTIIEMRKSGDLTKEQAATEWDLVGDIEDGQRGFEDWCFQTGLSDPWECARKKVAGEWSNFWDRLWMPCIKPSLDAYVKGQS